MRSTAKTTWGGNLLAAISDIVDGVRLFPVWGYLALRDIRSRYRRTLFGPFWIAGSAVITSLALGLVFGGLFGRPLGEIVPYIASGVIIWTYLSSFVFEGGGIFVMAAGTIKTLPLPYSFYIFKSAAINALIFAHNLVAFVIIVLILNHGLALNPIFVPGFVLVTLLGLAWALPIAIMAARYRDLLYMMSYVGMLAYFLTPIFWHIKDLPPQRAALMAYNPLIYPINVLRKPLFGEMPALADWTHTLAMLGVGVVVSLLVYAPTRRRIVFWL